VVPGGLVKSPTFSQKKKNITRTKGSQSSDWNLDRSILPSLMKENSLLLIEPEQNQGWMDDQTSHSTTQQKNLLLTHGLKKASGLASRSSQNNPQKKELPGKFIRAS